jgi:hypothetical protein
MARRFSVLPRFLGSRSFNRADFERPTGLPVGIQGPENEVT